MQFVDDQLGQLVRSHIDEHQRRYDVSERRVHETTAAFHEALEVTRALESDACGSSSSPSRSAADQQSQGKVVSTHEQRAAMIEAMETAPIMMGLVESVRRLEAKAARDDTRWAALTEKCELLEKENIALRVELRAAVSLMAVPSAPSAAVTASPSSGGQRGGSADSAAAVAAAILRGHVSGDDSSAAAASSNAVDGVSRCKETVCDQCFAKALCTACTGCYSEWYCSPACALLRREKHKNACDLLRATKSSATQK